MDLHFAFSHLHLPPPQHTAASRIRHVYMGQELINQLLGPGIYTVKFTKHLSESCTLAPDTESLGTDLSEAWEGSQTFTLPLRAQDFARLCTQRLRLWILHVEFVFLSPFLKRTSVLHSTNTTDGPLSGQGGFRLWLPSAFGQQPSIHSAFPNFISVSKVPNRCCGC